VRIALLTSDGRETFRRYGANTPLFGAAPAALIEGFSTLSAVEVHVISCFQELPNGVPAMLGPNIHFHAMHVPRVGWLRTAYQGCIRAVRKQLSEIKPDLTHGQGTERDCGICAVYSGGPNVVTIHGNMAELARMFAVRPFSYGWLTARLENWTLRRSGGVFCNSAYTEALVAPRTHRTWRVANPLRPEFFRVPKMARSETPLLVNIGVISPRKRQLEILRAASGWRESGVPFILEFIGDCEGADEYQQLFLSEVRRAEKDGYARYVGSLSAEQIVNRLDVARALIHFPTEEAFGLVVAEALARNLKLFASRVGGIIDIADQVDGADLIEAHDWEGLRQKITSWLAAGGPIPEDAASEMERRYSPVVIARRHLEIYEEVLSS
jgi:glycosyltransferase involved in cell wall biosynthesis